MDWQRNFLIIAIVAVLGLLFIRWNEFKEQQVELQAPVASEAILVPEVGDSTPQPAAGDQQSLGIPSATQEDESQPEATPEASERLITLTTDTLEITVDTYGGDIVKTALLKYPLTLQEDSKSMVILNRTSDTTYIAQSGLIGSNGTDTNKGRPRYSVKASQFQLSDGAEELVVDLVLDQGNALITKQFILRRGEYLVQMKYLVKNVGSQDWKAALFGQIQRDSHEPPAGDGFGMQPYVGAAITTPETNYEKVSFSDLEDESVSTEVTGGWVAMVQHYFISAWVPDQSVSNRFTLRKLGGKDLYTLGFVSPTTTVTPGETGTLSAAFYVGPKDQYKLEKISPYLDLTVDYGWLWWIAKLIFWGLTQIHSLLGNWGWAIILLTVFVKGIFYPLSAASYRSMAKMRKLQPEMARLKDLYGDDRQKLSQEMMSFYKKEKVNPMGGCLPILVQMPVFIALYWVLFESVELRHAPWILWINDLSVKDPYFVLPILNGICMFITTKLQPTPPDPTQAKVMQIMPVAFSFLFAFFPAGLVLYWTINSLLSIIQQWLITRQVEAQG